MYVFCLIIEMVTSWVCGCMIIACLSGTGHGKNLPTSYFPTELAPRLYLFMCVCTFVSPPLICFHLVILFSCTLLNLYCCAPVPEDGDEMGRQGWESGIGVLRETEREYFWCTELLSKLICKFCAICLIWSDLLSMLNIWFLSVPDIAAKWEYDWVWWDSHTGFATKLSPYGLSLKIF